MDKYKVIALFGPHGSGVEELCNYIIEYKKHYTHYIKTYVTDMNMAYQNNEKYLYISLENFTKKILDGSIIEASEKRIGFYGTDINFLVKDKINIRVYNINSINCLLQNPEIELYPIFVTSDQKDLIEQMLNESNYTPKTICELFLKDLKIYNKDNFDFDYTTIILPYTKDLYISTLADKIIKIALD